MFGEKVRISVQILRFTWKQSFIIMIQNTLANPLMDGLKRKNGGLWTGLVEVLIQIKLKCCGWFETGSSCKEAHKHVAAEGILDGGCQNGEQYAKCWWAFLPKGAIPAFEASSILTFYHNIKLYLLLILLNKYLKRPNLQHVFLQVYYLSLKAPCEWRSNACLFKYVKKLKYFHVGYLFIYFLHDYVYIPSLFSYKPGTLVGVSGTSAFLSTVWPGIFRKWETVDRL